MILKIQNTLCLKNIKWKSDAIYNSFWLSKFISIFFINGKKVKIENIIYSCFYKNRLLYNISIIFLFFESIEFIKLLINLITLNKVYRNTNKIIFPKPTAFLDQYKKIISILNQNIKQNSEITINSKIISEFLLLFQKQGNLYFKKENIETLSYQNHALKRYRWQN